MDSSDARQPERGVHTMEDDIVQMDAGDESDLDTAIADAEAIAGKQKGEDEDGIIAVLIG